MQLIYLSPSLTNTINEQTINLLKNYEIKKVFVANNIKCKQTAEILQKELKLSYNTTNDFNDLGFYSGNFENETGEQFFNRIKNCINKLINKANSNETILLISGTKTLSPIICGIYNVETTKKTPLTETNGFSPIIFKI